MLVSIASPLMQPSPNGRRVGIRIVTFCSSFTHVTAHRIAQSPKATFVTRLQPCRLPSRAARQLPDQSTILRMESSSTDNSRLRGARPLGDICVWRREVRRRGCCHAGKYVNRHNGLCVALYSCVRGRTQRELMQRPFRGHRLAKKISLFACLPVLPARFTGRFALATVDSN